MPRTLLVGVRVLDPGDPDTDAGPVAIETDGDRITWIGPAGDAPDRMPGARVDHLDGATVTPSFVDAHVHATASGLLLDGVDLTAAGSAEDCLDAVARYAAARPTGVIWGHGWQEDAWPGALTPSRAALDRAAGGRPVYLTRIDVHSALVSSALVDRARDAVGARGWSESAPLSGDAHHHVRRAALAAVDRGQRDRAQRAFLTAAAAAGIGTVHECAGPLVSGREDLAALLVLDAGVDVVGYWGEAVTTARDARALLAATGAQGLAGDLFVDGSLGSRTAALRAPYDDAPGCHGNRYLSADEITAHLVACSTARVQAGFHAIGDAAADLVVAGFEAAAAVVPPATVRDARHRLEHLEMLDPDQAAVLALLGVVASVQPAFDARWGGPDRLYASRLGPARASAMNAFAMLVAAGIPLAMGSDSPVTALDPWGAVAAAAAHSVAGSSIPRGAALAAHTLGGHHAARSPDPRAGRLVPGAPASYAVWDHVPPAGSPGRQRPGCIRTVRRGRAVHPVGPAGD